MDEFRAMIKESYCGKTPKVLDPFAGGGAIPLEAMRLGCDVTASDINPVAWLILKCTLDYPQQFAGKKCPCLTSSENGLISSKISLAEKLRGEGEKRNLIFLILSNYS
jgi:adenine-specific DNA methylase